jgi:enoyl-CoA hydratase/carnithine racemase
MMPERPYQAIRVGTKDRVCTITLDVPDRRNALGPDMVNELLYALDDAKDDDDTRVVVITGAGGVFSAGGDLKRMGGQAEGLEPKGDFADLLLRFRGLGKPTLARIPGVAMGGALGLIGSCDFAVCAESAVLGTPEIRRGLWPMMIMAVLQRIMPRRRLLNMMLLGEKLSAREALENGLVSHVALDHELDEKVREIAHKLAEQSPTAMRMGLDAFHRQADQNLETALPYLRDQLFALLGTEDAQEGLQAFFEKRDPEWKNR